MKESEFIVDFFGNEIRVGDRVVCSVGNHAGLCFGEVVRLGSTCTTVDIKIIYAPFDGYWKCAKNAIGQIKKNVKVLVNREEHFYYKEDEKFMMDTLMTAYSYCIKFNFDSIMPQYQTLDRKER